MATFRIAFIEMLALAVALAYIVLLDIGLAVMAAFDDKMDDAPIVRAP